MKKKNFNNLLQSIDEARKISKGGQMNINSSIWRYFVECECHGEGIMIGYDSSDPFPQLDLAFFSLGLKGKGEMSIKEKIRWCWHIITKGYPWNDEIMLRQETAKELAKHLLEFANKKFESNK